MTRLALLLSLPLLAACDLNPTRACADACFRGGGHMVAYRSSVPAWRDQPNCECATGRAADGGGL